MHNKKYDSLVTELSSLILRHAELEAAKVDAELDLKWRLTQLYKDVIQEDEQKFINISGMHAHLTTSEQKSNVIKSVNIENRKNPSKLSEIYETKKNNLPDKAWVKLLYKRAVRRCHPDTFKNHDDEYKKELTMLYQSITESYENGNLDILMVETYKLFIKPRKVTSDQLQILEESKLIHTQKINSIISSQGYVWSTFNDEMKENFLINMMKQRGVRFVNKEKIREVLRKKVSNRKPGQKPKNKIRARVKSKK